MKLAHIYTTFNHRHNLCDITFFTLTGRTYIDICYCRLSPIPTLSIDYIDEEMKSTIIIDLLPSRATKFEPEMISFILSSLTPLFPYSYLFHTSISFPSFSHITFTVQFNFGK
jgi:hypothetical protein